MGYLEGEESEYVELSDRDLLRASARGDRAARNALYFRYRALIAATARRVRAESRLGSDEGLEPEDVDQQAFIIFCELLEEWDDTRTPLPVYLSHQLRWHLRHFVRAHRSYARKLTTMPPLEEMDTVPQLVDAGEQDATMSEVSWRQRTARLRREYRTPLDLKYGHGLSSKEIAKITGCSYRAANRVLRAAEQAVRTQLEDEQEGCA